MTDSQIKAMILDLVQHLDYDLSKQLDPRFAEEPEFAEELMSSLVDIAQAHLTDLVK